MLTYYFANTIRNVSVALMDMFTNIQVVKYDSSGTSADVYTVPIQFGPTEKEYQQRTENFSYTASATDSNGYTQSESVGQRFWLSLPRMSLVLNGIAYDSERAYGVNEWRSWFAETLVLSGTNNVDKILLDYAPTPFSCNYTLHIMTDSIDHLSQILENIIVYFNPSLFLRVKEFSFLNVERDLKVTMPGVVTDFISPEISEDDRRYVNGTLDLTVEAWMYRPFEYSSIIKIIDSKYFVGDLVAPVVSAETFSTSGFELTSAGDIPSGVPVNETIYQYGLSADTTYYWRVNASNQYGNSNYSDNWSITTSGGN